MLGIHDFGVFLAAGVLLNLTPGQDTVYILSRALAHGRKIGVASAIGISSGGLIHTLAAALGLSAVLATSATAFLLLKFIGAGYLVYLGARMLASRTPVVAREASFAGVSAAAAYRQGIITNVTNPKVALFFLAFLPQFIAADSPTKIAAFFLLGATFLMTGTIWCLILAVSAASVRDAFAARTGVLSFVSRATGALFIALGLRLAVSRP